MNYLSKIIISLIFFAGLSCAQKSTFDHSLFDNLLKNNVDENGMVNYKAFLNSTEFENYLNKIADADISEFSNDEKLAFYINAYNACTIKNVMNHWPIDSPMDVKGFFKETKFKVAGKELTLDELEYDRTLKIEPVLSHFGLVCAAMSCPKLLPKVYSGKSVRNQLEQNGKDFLSDKEKNKLGKKNNVLYLSELFKWFKKYFEESYGSLLNTAVHFMNEEDKAFIEMNNPEIKFIPYNWDLNKQ